MVTSTYDNRLFSHSQSNFLSFLHAVPSALSSFHLYKAKCGSTTMMQWLHSHNETLSFNYEVTHLSHGKIGSFIKKLYYGLELPTSSNSANTSTIGTAVGAMTTETTKRAMTLYDNYQRGYKSPVDVQNIRAINLIREYFPQTKLFIGIRHPIRWFESFYNHRIQNSGEAMPQPHLLTLCIRASRGVCMNRAKYHMSLVRFGKTNFSNNTMVSTGGQANEDEKNLFSNKDYQELVKDPPIYAPNRIFLYDTDQLADADAFYSTVVSDGDGHNIISSETEQRHQRGRQFQFDAQEFMGFQTPMPPIVHYIPGKTGWNETEQAKRDTLKINICDAKYYIVRQTLLDIGTNAATWIRDYFLQSPDVFVSSRDHFVNNILESYKHDPCVQ